MYGQKLISNFLIWSHLSKWFPILNTKLSRSPAGIKLIIRILKLSKAYFTKFLWSHDKLFQSYWNGSHCVPYMLRYTNVDLMFQLWHFETEKPLVSETMQNKVSWLCWITIAKVCFNMCFFLWRTRKMWEGFNLCIGHLPLSCTVL